ncbi:thioesterase family protein [Methylorubrum salsuginis]|uniref:Acyl-CoA thioester hydrolase, YbgC/YbaW family n=1 Tax=Methylorubrum salsuginis TaxID=414703 RepID=A0A1I4IGR3_9HYPH|nr:thioesterase family protein [Methylorubrum salsuginis]SFL52966.1 acyl-CoA thioester hydrolase, YbgC/YbaW family [Methylorubrum salsuginis]
MRSNLSESLSWSPTVALSWLWGLGFFYAVHVVLAHGWAGFAAFALPNALGLFLFGWVLGDRRRDPAAILRRAEGAYAGLFLLAQLFAVAITLFALFRYVGAPLFGERAAGAIVGLVLVAAILGHALTLRRLRWVHAGLLALGIGAGFVAWTGLGMAAPAGPTPLFVADERFFGLVAPTLVGFLLGPWTDLQHWQRVVEIRRGGGSVRLAYGVGAVLFLGLLTLNALIASAAGPAGAVTTADGLAGFQPAVAAAVLRTGLDGAGLAFALWAAIAALSTIDSAYAALRWSMTGLTARSQSVLLTFVPASLVASPLWIVLAAGALAAAVAAANLSMIYLMLPFATLLAGAAACLLLEVLGAQRAYDPVLCALLGATAALLAVAGYVTPNAALLTLAALVPLIGALPMLAQYLGWSAPAPAVPAPAPEPTATVIRVVNDHLGGAEGFEGRDFVIRLTPTYDDTNSVGNIYFANYVRWVGKARELFFRHCVPDFDLASTEFYILTKSFQHDFRREAREFEALTVRIRVKHANRKFVTLEHEIHSAAQGLLGRGEQSLMFVDTRTYRPLDIPKSIVEGFLPYAPAGAAPARWREEPALAPPMAS